MSVFFWNCIFDLPTSIYTFPRLFPAALQTSLIFVTKTHVSYFCGDRFVLIGGKGLLRSTLLSVSMLEVQALTTFPHLPNSLRIPGTSYLHAFGILVQKPPCPLEILKAACCIGMDIFWHHPLEKMENDYIHTEYIIS